MGFILHIFRTSLLFYFFFCPTLPGETTSQCLSHLPACYSSEHFQGQTQGVVDLSSFLESPARSPAATTPVAMTTGGAALGTSLWTLTRWRGPASLRQLIQSVHRKDFKYYISIQHTPKYQLDVVRTVEVHGFRYWCTCTATSWSTAPWWLVFLWRIYRPTELYKLRGNDHKNGPYVCLSFPKKRVASGRTPVLHLLSVPVEDGGIYCILSSSCAEKRLHHATNWASVQWARCQIACLHKYFLISRWIWASMSAITLVSSQPDGYLVFILLKCCMSRRLRYNRQK